MGIAENKKLIREFLETLPTGDVDWDVIAEDAEWWIQGMGTIGKEQFRQVAAGIAEMTSKGEMFLDHVTAEEDRVAVEAHSRIEMTDGRLFQNTYHFLFILKDGRIVSGREHFDTAYAREFFGAGVQQGLVGETG